MCAATSPDVPVHPPRGHAAWFWAALAVAGVATAKVPTCVRVAAPGAAPTTLEGLRLLVDAAVRDSSTHHPDADCTTTVTVEVVTLGERTTVTAWLPGQSPERATANAGAVEPAVTQAVHDALAADPTAALSDDAALERLIAGSDPVARGTMSYGVEVSEATLWIGDDATWSPALGLRIRRGLGPFHVGGRLRVAFLPVSPAEGALPVPTVNVAFEPEFAWFVLPDATTSPYLGAALGISVVRFDGRDAGGSRTLVDWGVHASARAGVEFLRASDVRADLFVQASLPWFAVDSETSDLVDDWTPTVEVGFGVAF